jgi:hypothetical protein
MGKICECGKEFVVNRKDKKYCSRACARKHYDYKSIVTLRCVGCGVGFSIEKSDYTRRMQRKNNIFYCSHSCSAKNSNKNRAEKRVLTCESCKKEFLLNASDAKDRYCSNKCYVTHQHDRLTEQCLNLRGQKNRYHKGAFFSVKNNRTFYYRSSWELKYMEFLEKDSNISTYQYESIKLPYYYRKDKKWYIPDFIVGNRLIEIKPVYMMNKKRNIAKFSSARLYCQQNNMTFEVITEKELKALGIL